MNETFIQIPEESARALGLEPNAAGELIRLAAAVKLYELNRLSSGAAAKIAGIPRAVFLTKLGEFDALTFSMTEAELRNDIESA
ncbi:MAG: UPF0175 family protein [Acidobacteriota bacterium]